MSRYGENHPNFGKSSGMKGKKHFEETKKKIRDAASLCKKLKKN